MSNLLSCQLQNDIHSPCITVHESLLFSARLRFTKDVNRKIVDAFVEEVTLPGSHSIGVRSAVQLTAIATNHVIPHAVIREF
jgi:ABC-type multidrug transport system ATPase subunit